MIWLFIMGVGVGIFLAALFVLLLLHQVTPLEKRKEKQHGTKT